MAKDVFDSFRNCVADVHAELKRIEFTHDSLNEKIAKLEKEGVVNASPHWKDGKYLVLVHPDGAFTKIVDGKEVPYRKREYIGLESEKTDEALAKLARYDEWVKLTAERDRIHGRLSEWNTRMNCFLSEMKWLKKQKV